MVETWTVRRHLRYHCQRMGWQVGMWLDRINMALWGLVWQTRAEAAGWWVLRPLQLAGQTLLHRCYDPVNRVWWQSGTRRCRALFVFRYPPPTYRERMYVCRIADEDPRPRGDRILVDNITVYAESLPVGHWSEVVFEPPSDPASISARLRYASRGPRALLTAGGAA